LLDLLQPHSQIVIKGSFLQDELNKHIVDPVSNRGNFLPQRHRPLPGAATQQQREGWHCGSKTIFDHLRIHR
jgi:hypothetical protein